MSAHDDAARTGHALVQILGRIDAALTQPRRCCDVCGCLCRRGENCPSCAISAATITHHPQGAATA